MVREPSQAQPAQASTQAQAKPGAPAQAEPTEKSAPVQAKVTAKPAAPKLVVPQPVPQPGSKLAQSGSEQALVAYFAQRKAAQKADAAAKQAAAQAVEKVSDQVAEQVAEKAAAKVAEKVDQGTPAATPEVPASQTSQPVEQAQRAETQLAQNQQAAPAFASAAQTKSAKIDPKQGPAAAHKSRYSDARRLLQERTKEVLQAQHKPEPAAEPEVASTGVESDVSRFNAFQQSEKAVTTAETYRHQHRSQQHHLGAEFVSSIPESAGVKSSGAKPALQELATEDSEIALVYDASARKSGVPFQSFEVPIPPEVEDDRFSQAKQTDFDSAKYLEELALAQARQFHQE